MDNARDMVDVRNMVVLHKLRLTGPNSAIEGLFNGPAWYYLLAIPFILSGGDPYASIIMEIILWAIGGFFLLKLVSKWGTFYLIPIGALWISSNYIFLTNLYAFNPNPVTLLTPLFVYLLFKYIQTNQLIWAVSVWFLGGLFFNFEMNFGIFVPAIIFLSIIFSGEINLLKTKNFWIGSLFFGLTLLPQVLFDIKHEYIMSNSVLKFIAENQGRNTNLSLRFMEVKNSFYQTFSATMMNQKNLSLMLLIISIPFLYKFFKTKLQKRDLVVLISLLIIFVPFLGYLILPVAVNPWHLGAPMAAAVILVGFALKSLFEFKIWGRLISLVLAGFIIFFSLGNIKNFYTVDAGKPNHDPSAYVNEIAAIDYAYRKADGKNFKVYAYLPSVIDYPYQYLIWWRGRSRYGYLPQDYAYSPNKPQYIADKEKFLPSKEEIDKREDSKLVFLIKEPDRIRMRQAWENDYKDLEFVSKEMIGPLEVEIRQGDLSQ